MRAGILADEVADATNETEKYAPIKLLHVVTTSWHKLASLATWMSIADMLGAAAAAEHDFVPVQGVCNNEFYFCLFRSCSRCVQQ